MSPAARKTALSYLWITLGSALFCLGFNWLVVPNGISLGGVTGIAQVLHALIPALPIGAVALALNLPLFLLGWRFLGGKALVSSLFAMLLTSVGIDLLSSVYTFRPLDDPMLAALIGGAIVGLSLGIIFTQGATTGGTDLAARLVKLKLAWLPLGKVLMGLDLCVILAYAVALRELYSALYGVVALAVSTYLADTVLYGLDTSKVAYIITSRPDEVLRAITHGLDRGVTILRGQGGWSGQDKPVLLCAFRQRQIVSLKRAVRELDPDAFLIVCDAREVLGEGFHSHGADDI